MLSKKSNHIVKLYKDVNWQPRLLNILKRVLNHVKLNESDIKEVIEKNINTKKQKKTNKTKKLKSNKLKSNNNDKKIIENLRKTVINPMKGYETDKNIGRAFRKWRILKPQLRGIHVNSMLDYGGGVGDTAFILGRKILKLSKDKTFVVDIDTFGGFRYVPRDDITFIHFNDIDNFDANVDLITVSHVMHHINSKLYKKILELFNRILSKNGIIMLYEHDCSDKKMESIINIEHCLYDVVNSQKITYNDFIDDFYAKYLSINDWKNVFSEYFIPVKIIELKNDDNSFYMFLKRKPK